MTATASSAPRQSDESHGAGRAVRAGGYLLSLALRSRAELRRALRTTGAKLLDEQFDSTSPLPVMEWDACRTPPSTPITLPSLGVLRAGNQAVEGLMHLVSLARSVGASTIFEFGTYNGLTSWVVARNLPEATVHTLDIPPDQRPALRISEPDESNIAQFAEDRAYAGTPEASRIVQHLGDSAQFDFDPFRGKCDLVYVDGAHSYEYVENDSTAALEIVSPHGVIVWDDYWRQVPEVARYLHTRGDLPLKRLASSRLVACFAAGIRKKPLADSQR